MYSLSFLWLMSHKLHFSPRTKTLSVLRTPGRATGFGLETKPSTLCTSLLKQKYSSDFWRGSNLGRLGGNVRNAKPPTGEGHTGLQLGNGVKQQTGHRRSSSQHRNLGHSLGSVLAIPPARSKGGCEYAKDKLGASCCSLLLATTLILLT